MESENKKNRKRVGYSERKTKERYFDVMRTHCVLLSGDILASEWFVRFTSDNYRMKKEHLERSKVIKDFDKFREIVRIFNTMVLLYIVMHRVSNVKLFGKYSILYQPGPKAMFTINQLASSTRYAYCVPFKTYKAIRNIINLLR